MDNHHSEEALESDYTVNITEYTNKTLQYGLYNKLSQFERHFESITTKYKNIALTWLLATYGAIGFLLSGEVASLPINHFLAVGIVSFIGTIGVALIWHLDMNVYHRFWAALFIEEVVIEEKNSFLLQSKKIAHLIDESRERVFSQGLLYQIANTLLIITIFVSLASLFRGSNHIIIFCLFLFSALIIFNWKLMDRPSKEIHQVIHLLIKERLKR